MERERKAIPQTTCEICTLCRLTLTHSVDSSGLRNEQKVICSCMFKMQQCKMFSDQLSHVAHTVRVQSRIPQHEESIIDVDSIDKHLRYPSTLWLS